MNAKEKRAILFDRLMECLPDGLTVKTSDYLWLIDEKNKYIVRFSKYMSRDGTFLESGVNYCSFFQDPLVKNFKIPCCYFDPEIDEYGMLERSYYSTSLSVDQICQKQIDEVIQSLWHFIIPMLNNISSFDDYRCMDSYIRRNHSPRDFYCMGNPVWDIAYAEGREKACEYLSNSHEEQDNDLLLLLQGMNDAELSELLHQRENRMKKAYAQIIRMIHAASGVDH